MSDCMASAVQASGVTRTVTFRQKDLLTKATAVGNYTKRSSDGEMQGICFGLALVWLEYRARKSHERFFDDVNAWQDKATLYKAAGVWDVLQKRVAVSNRADDWDAVAGACGLSVEHDKDRGAERRLAYFDVTEPKEMRALADWLAAANGRRYFLISTRRHAMAASGSRFGMVDFFDPNFGVVKAFSCSNMAKFLSAFFTEREIGRYWRAHPHSLAVTKFKARG